MKQSACPFSGTRRILRSSGFTLVELIVVITILAILGTIAFISLSGFQSSSRDSARITDLKSAKSSMELYAAKAGTYPTPSAPLKTITYSGGTVFTEGTIGDSVIRALGMLSKKITDPKYSVEYAYSINGNGTQYQVASALEGGTVSYVPSAYADSAPIAYINGNYNGFVAKVSSGSTVYVLALPTISTSLNSSGSYDIATMSGSLVFKNKGNLPFTYQPTGLTVTGSVSFTPNGSGWVVYSSGALPSTDSEMSLFMNNLQAAYSGTIVSDSQSLSIVNATGTPELNLAKSIVSNWLGNSTNVVSASQIIPPGGSGTNCIFDNAASTFDGGCTFQ